MHDTARLRALIAEYDRLRSREGGTLSPQLRGTQLNEFIACMLRVWGIDARASTLTPAGEIDVSFSLNGQRFIAEAKWEQAKTDVGPLAKLALRLAQRMRGTFGIFISMAGYTSDALADLRSSGERSILLLDRNHLEAMISGLVPPEELFGLALDHGSFSGQVYVPLLEMLAPSAPAPTVTFEPLPHGADGLLSGGMSTRVVCAISGTHQLGMTSAGTGKILAVHPDGIAEIDHVKRAARWRVPIHGCHGDPVLRSDGSILFARRHAIGALSSGRLDIVAGGFPDRCSLLAKPDGSVWVLDPIDEAANTVTPTVVRLGVQLGDEQRHEIHPPPPWPVDAAWLDDTRLVLAHTSFCSLVDDLEAGIPQQVRIATSDCVGVVPLNLETIMTVSGHAEIDLVDLVTNRSARLAISAHRPVVRGFAPGDATTTYLAVEAEHATTAIVVVEFQRPVAEVVAQAFAACDSGDLVGYRRQVLGLAGRHVPASGKSNEDLQALYGDLLRLVYERLDKPIGHRIEAMGLKLVQEQPRRSFDGAWPPGYGGSASCPRWRRPGVDGPWLEAWIGLCHRTWPLPSLNDLVITLVLAIVNDQSQHTLLTRFTPVVPGDIGLDSTIESLLADIDQTLPIAVGMLTDEPT